MVFQKPLNRFYHATDFCIQKKRGTLSRSPLNCLVKDNDYRVTYSSSSSSSLLQSQAFSASFSVSAALPSFFGFGFGLQSGQPRFTSFVSAASASSTVAATSLRLHAVLSHALRSQVAVNPSAAGSFLTSSLSVAFSAQGNAHRASSANSDRYSIPGSLLKRLNNITPAAVYFGVGKKSIAFDPVA